MAHAGSSHGPVRAARCLARRRRDRGGLASRAQSLSRLRDSRRLPRSHVRSLMETHLCPSCDGGQAPFALRLRWASSMKEGSWGARRVVRLSYASASSRRCSVAKLRPPSFLAPPRQTDLGRCAAREGGALISGLGVLLPPDRRSPGLYRGGAVSAVGRGLLQKLVATCRDDPSAKCIMSAFPARFVPYPSDPVRAGIVVILYDAIQATGISSPTARAAG